METLPRSSGRSFWDVVSRLISIRCGMLMDSGLADCTNQHRTGTRAWSA